MINQGYVEGIRVTSSYPFTYEQNVDVDRPIKLELNIAPDTSTIMNAVKIIDGKNIGQDALGELTVELFLQEPHLECTVTYNHEKRIIEVQPRAYLEIDNKYIIIVEGLKDIYGNEQVDSYISIFYTSSLNTVKPIELLYPPNNAVIDRLTEFQWIKEDTDGYLFELSKDSDFSICDYRQEIYDKELKTLDNVVNFIPSVILNENTYYWRARALDGNWSEVNSFYYQPNDITPVTREDIKPTDASYEDLPLLEDYEILETNIEESFVDNKLNVIHYKISGLVSEDEIVEILLYSDSDEEEIELEYSLLYDSEEDVTHLILIPKKKVGEE